MNLFRDSSQLRFKPKRSHFEILIKQKKAVLNEKTHFEDSAKML